MSSEAFFANLARGAVAVGVVGACVTAQKQTEAPSVPDSACETFCAGLTTVPHETENLATKQQVVFTVHQNPTAWDRKLEREFRDLALEEAKGTLSRSNGRRLEYLTRWRNLLLDGQSTEEILFQLKRDRLLARMESVLKEYVDFQDLANKKGTGA